MKCPSWCQERAFTNAVLGVWCLVMLSCSSDGTSPPATDNPDQGRVTIQCVTGCLNANIVVRRPCDPYNNCPNPRRVAANRENLYEIFDIINTGETAATVTIKCGGAGTVTCGPGPAIYLNVINKPVLTVLLAQPVKIYADWGVQILVKYKTGLPGTGRIYASAGQQQAYYNLLAQ